MSTVVTSTRQRVYSANVCCDLVVVACGWQRETAEREGIEAIIAGRVPVDRYWTATQDGRGYIPEWHEGESSDVVYVERWVADGRAFHGWIDVESRRIVQAG